MSNKKIKLKNIYISTLCWNLSGIQGNKNCLKRASDLWVSPFKQKKKCAVQNVRFVTRVASVLDKQKVKKWMSRQTNCP